ncbi:MAG: Hpt domain-containing protein [Campylobacterota bacterium]|nr:Hpt domain-containing protein [Campylobacterota bacterium]
MEYTIDLQKIAESLDFDLEDIEMLMEVFLEGANESLAALKEAIDSNDMDGIYKSAHFLKGSSANLTLADISELAREIELNAREQNTIEYASKYNELKNMVDALIK